jgi:cysteine-rich repeat protein
MRPAQLIISCLILASIWGCTAKKKGEAELIENVVDISVTPTNDEDTPVIEELCGNGTLDAGEECDEGIANSDDTADSCRTTCVLPYCGDTIVDTTEVCDDGNIWGGDGCTSLCVEESSPGETEPNDTRFEPQTATQGTTTVGALYPEHDKDCYSVTVPEGSWLDVSVTLPGDDCPAPLTLEVIDPAGEVLLSYFPSLESNCVSIKPETAGNEVLQYLVAGEYVVCVEGFFQTVVPDYRITLTTEATSCTRTDFSPALASDIDGDTLPDVCDDDDDGDGALDAADNCPTISNNGTGVTFMSTVDGFIRNWLLAGPVTGTTTTDGCLPSVDDLGAVADATLQVSPGDSTGDYAWEMHIGEDSLVNILTHWTGATPRETYAMAYVYTENERAVKAAFGFDDGAVIWVNQTVLGQVPTCQGAGKDKFVYPVTLNAGWNSILLKIRDRGGGWGFYSRFLDDGNEPVLDLTFALDPVGGYQDTQADLDEDGIGDLCDPTPNGDEDDDEG